MNQVNECNSTFIRFPPLAATIENCVAETMDINNSDNANPSPKMTTIHTSRPALNALETMPCIGIHLVFPSGKNHHTSYPFGLHSSCIIPWNYYSIEDRFYLQSKCCSHVAHPSGDDGQYWACYSCERIWSNDQFKSIFKQIKCGVHVNTLLDYQPIGGLVQIVRKKTEQLEEMHLTKLNNNRTLARQAASLADHK